jgi:hypothetical protein
MVTVATLLLLLGVCFLIAGATSLALKAGANRARKIIERTPATPVGTWRPGRARVAALGTTAFGPAGPVIAPLSEVEVAWYRHQLLREPSRSKDESPPPHDVLVDSSSPSPALADSSGSVLLDPRLLVEAPNLDDPIITQLAFHFVERGSTHPAMALVPGKFLADLRSYETLKLWEIRLVAGKQAYAVGSAGKGSGPDKGSVVLTPSRRGIFSVLTSDERSTVIERRRTNAREARAMALTLSRIGLVVTVVAGILLYLAV